MPDDEALVAGFGVVGVGLLGLVAWLVAGDSSSDPNDPGGSGPVSGDGTIDLEDLRPGDSLTGVTGTIDFDVGGDGSGGSADPDNFETPWDAYQAELRDTDTGD
jgi:hypothetical protein